MVRFFKREEKRPFHYPTIIEERKQTTGYFPWIAGGILLVALLGIFLYLT